MSDRKRSPVVIVGSLLLVLAGWGDWHGRAAAAGFSGRVTHIPDGDTVAVLKEGARYSTEVDLYGIDCPERQQAFGMGAKSATANLVGNKMVWAEVIETSAGGRQQVVITVAGKELNAELLSRGWAWVLPKGCALAVCSRWLQLAAEARSRRIGLWMAPEPVPPWVWRAKGKKEPLYVRPDGTPVWRYLP